ncbi:hypothetical protein GCM10027290_43230 [Micromonospora sonneratiae]
MRGGDEIEPNVNYRKVANGYSWSTESVSGYGRKTGQISTTVHGNAFGAMESWLGGSSAG